MYAACITEDSRAPAHAHLLATGALLWLVEISVLTPPAADGLRLYTSAAGGCDASVAKSRAGRAEAAGTAADIVAVGIEAGASNTPPQNGRSLPSTDSAAQCCAPMPVRVAAALMLSELSGFGRDLERGDTVNVNVNPVALTRNVLSHLLPAALLDLLYPAENFPLPFLHLMVASTSSPTLIWNGELRAELLQGMHPPAQCPFLRRARTGCRKGRSRSVG
jgi:hypothetical protein